MNVRILATCPRPSPGEAPLDPEAIQEQLASWLLSNDPAFCLPAGVEALVFTTDGRLIGSLACRGPSSSSPTP